MTRDDADQVNRLVIFDCDGTLVNTIDDVCACFNEALSISGLPTRDPHDIAKYVGLPLEKIVEGIIPSASVAAGMVPVVSSEYRAAYAKSEKRNTRLFPGMGELVGWLKRQGIKVAVNSNKPEENLRSLVKALLAHESISIAGYVPGRAVKPSGEGAKYLMAQCGASPEHTLYIGDTWVDAETAKDTGVDCAIVTWGQGTSALYGATEQALLCETPFQLKEVIRSKLM